MDKNKSFLNTKGVAYWLLPLIAGVLAGALLHNYILPDPYPSTTISQEATPSFKLMAEAWNAIEQQYVDRTSVQPRTMTYGAISGMVDSLGDTGHSVFLTPEMVRVERTVERGEFAGIGAELRIKNHQAVVVAPMDGTPAQKAGLRPGDIIVQVDGRNVEGLPLPEIVGKITGPAGTRVSLTLKDPVTGKERTIEIIRANIPIRSVTWNWLPGTDLAHVRIALFSKGTSRALEKALDEIDQRGAKGVVLDLRNDPGGLLDMAVGVASQFLEQGNVLQEKNAKGEVRPVPLDAGAQKCALPLVVLINSGTASAAEIVAGALQDAKRATLVGETTFGTGTVLKTVPLSDGSALQLAFLEWLTPKGRTIWHKGITPDVAVSLPAEAQPLVPEEEQGMTAVELRMSEDLQLLRAINILQGRQPSQ
ncbi:MAG: S41 family peptidase [Nitrospiraceae bacterium]|nr:S41 family peptidase [Nitrospiraceae bacterium]